jgi:hypothetical protein
MTAPNPASGLDRETVSDPFMFNPSLRIRTVASRPDDQKGEMLILHQNHSGVLSGPSLPEA